MLVSLFLNNVLFVCTNQSQSLTLAIVWCHGGQCPPKLSTGKFVCPTICTLLLLSNKALCCHKKKTQSPLNLHDAICVQQTFSLSISAGLFLPKRHPLCPLASSSIVELNRCRLCWDHIQQVDSSSNSNVLIVSTDARANADSKF